MPDEITEPPAATEAAEVAAAPRKRAKRTVPHARVCIRAGLNNTIVTVTDERGDALAWASAGSCGFKGTRKSTPYAAKVTAEKAVEKVQAFGVKTVSVEVKGIGPGREQAIRGLQGAGLDFDKLIDTTPISHGGCRPKRRRRI
jgi:small subunit ribosomal protein S11